MLTWVEKAAMDCHLVPRVGAIREISRRKSPKAYSFLWLNSLLMENLLRTRLLWD